MRLAILATEEQKNEIITKKIVEKETTLVFIKNIFEIKNYSEFDAFFLLTEMVPSLEPEAVGGKPVVINSVINTLESAELPSNFSRTIGWPGFLKREIWEIASNSKTATEELFGRLGWGAVFVKDEPGFVAARILSMIINEAYFTIGESVSTINEIDLAMKYGTNYPLGPFEWEAVIGIENIYLLLKKLSDTNNRYAIAPLLEEKFKEFTRSQLQ
ncbi:MAG: 3-hydroxyacyl-CoA dehydrogenase family protein [Ginsengibacter sp.]